MATGGPVFAIRGEGARLREARLETLERTLALATTHAVDAHLQILILTCRPDRYRGVGQAITFAA